MYCFKFEGKKLTFQPFHLFILKIMAKENGNTTTNETPAPNPMASMFGDMSLLRDIIMGPKVVEYNDRFEAVHALIEKNNSQTNALIEKNNNEIRTLIGKNEAATNARFEALERDMNAKFEHLEQLLNQNVENLTKLIQETSKSDKATLADLLIGVSQKLKG